VIDSAGLLIEGCVSGDAEDPEVQPQNQIEDAPRIRALDEEQNRSDEHEHADDAGWSISMRAG
jgi:hypothetical protein